MLPADQFYNCINFLNLIEIKCTSVYCVPGKVLPERRVSLHFVLILKFNRNKVDVSVYLCTKCVTSAGVQVLQVCRSAVTCINLSRPVRHVASCNIETHFQESSICLQMSGFYKPNLLLRYFFS